MSSSVESEIFEQLDSIAQQNGPLAALELMIQRLETEGRYHELFECLKMKVRMETGLSPVARGNEDSLSEAIQDRLEKGLIAACRRVGLGFLKAAQIREGWMYMRPVGDKAAVAKALQDIPVTSENLDDLLQVLVHEGIDVSRGYSLALSHMGTCNSITLFETAIAHRPKADQQAAATLLVRHLHRELMQSLKADISSREGQAAQGDTAEELLSTRPGLLRDGTYHLDTTHLASTVRFARVLQDPSTLRLALDLTYYGRQLQSQYQYPGDEPFLDQFPASANFFRVLLGQAVEPGLRYFAQKAESLDVEEHGTVAIETYADLLSRIGRPKEALHIMATMIPVNARLCGIAPTLLELSQQAEDFSTMMNHAKGRNDSLSYLAALLQSSTNQIA